MTDTTTPLTHTLPGCLYKQRDGVLLMATGATSVRPLKGGAARYLTADTTFYASPSHPDWSTAMTEAWRALVDQVAALESTRQSLINRYQSLGGALLEKAEEHGWCGEYEEFAEEWDLPKRTKDFWVTITVQTENRNAEEAEREIDNLLRGRFEDYGYDITVEERGD